MSTDKDVKTSYVDVFATTAAFIVGLGVLLFVVRSRRPKEAKTTISAPGASQGNSSSKSTNYSMAKSNIPTFTKVLVPDDGKEISDKALNFAISLSNLSGAEIVILRIIENIEKMGDTSVSVAQNKQIDTKKDFKYNAEGDLVNAMEEKIKKCVEAGAKNKISYEIKVGGNVTEQIVKACEETRYDLVIMTTFHLDSWLKSLFSEARKIISKIDTPVLLVQ